MSSKIIDQSLAKTISIDEFKNNVLGITVQDENRNKAVDPNDKFLTDNSTKYDTEEKKLKVLGNECFTSRPKGGAPVLFTKEAKDILLKNGFKIEVKSPEDRPYKSISGKSEHNSYGRYDETISACNYNKVRSFERKTTPDDSTAVPYTMYIKSGRYKNTIVIDKENATGQHQDEYLVEEGKLIPLPKAEEHTSTAKLQVSEYNRKHKAEGLVAIDQNKDGFLDEEDLPKPQREHASKILNAECHSLVTWKPYLVATEEAEKILEKHGAAIVDESKETVHIKLKNDGKLYAAGGYEAADKACIYNKDGFFIEAGSDAAKETVVVHFEDSAGKHEITLNVETGKMTEKGKTETQQPQTSSHADQQKAVERALGWDSK